jgi:hypothetical protein
MKYLVKPVLVLSALGLFLSLIAHITALAGLDLHLGNWIFVLHGGIFIVWFPAVILAMRLGRGKTRSPWGFGFASWKQVLAGCPPWMTYLLIGLFIYALLNFFFFMGNVSTHVSLDGQPASTDVIRGFSGHWLVFYSAAFAIAYSAFKRPELLGTAICKMGHKALPTEKFCSECGNPVIVKPVA